MVDPGQLALDIAGNVALLALPAALWALLYLLAWDHGPFARSLGFGRWTFWLLLPGALLASFALLPIAPVANDWLAVSFAGALFPILIACLAFRRIAAPASRSVALFLGGLVAEATALLVLVVALPASPLENVLVIGVAAVVPVALGAVALARSSVLVGRVAMILALTSGVIVGTFLASAAVPGLGIEESFPAYLLPPIGAAVVAVIAADWWLPRAEALALPAAYAAATFGVLVGADVLRQPPLYGAGTPAGLYAIGGAGVLDLVYLSGLLALGAAFVAHRALGRGYEPVGGPEPDPAPSPISRLGRAFREGVDGQIDPALTDAASASRDAAAQAQRLLGQPPAPADRPWQGLPVPGWVVSDQANLDAVARAGSSDGREGFRAFLTARGLVLIGRELGARRFASVGARAAAFALDLVIVTAPAAAVWVALVLATPGSLDALASNVAFNASVYGFAAVAFLYFVLAEAWGGRTVGKALLGLSVRDRALRSPGLPASLVRNASKIPTLTILGIGLAVGLLLLLKAGSGGTLTTVGGVAVSTGLVDFLGTVVFVVGGVGLLGALGILTILLTAERQRFGDLVAGTWVVRTTPPAGAPPRGAPAPAASGGGPSG